MGHTSTEASALRRTPRRARAPIAALAAVLVLAACGGDSDDASVAAAEGSATPAYGLVTPAQAAALAADPDITVIDVRTPEEFGEGHVEGATMIDFYTDTFADEIAALDRDGEYLLYCRSGNRSGQTAALMEQLGFEQVYDLDGGVRAWAADGRTLTP
ncbi:MAG: rhodanese-like domain-containing protein [Ilumatobacter sp.]|uniref:rhodanese-like domain-containing protein n=1 Tax=Ilumatobacter sp. TaxID=1967498 RepID=UPI00261D68F5|nr:rhodanese-like domain-containing protein [Ilumatobacter sp.]MDJ0768415.1 rhodanese-like domain-containing protein [Ilumatobacter sp.]